MIKACKIAMKKSFMAFVKGNVDEFDVEVEEAIKQSLHNDRPDYSFLGEETGEDFVSESRMRFIVDPIDGTNNFKSGIPIFGVSIALEINSGDGPQIVAGAIGFPMTNEVFWAERGKGAFFEDDRGVTKRYSLKGKYSTVSCVRGYKMNEGVLEDLVQILLLEGQKIRYFGSTTYELVLVSKGALCCAAYDRPYRDIDCAAGLILVVESGGVLGKLPGGESLIATGNTSIFKKSRATYGVL